MSFCEPLMNNGRGFRCKLCYGTQMLRSRRLREADREFIAGECGSCGLFQVLYNWGAAAPLTVTHDFDLSQTDMAWSSDAELAANKDKCMQFAGILDSRRYLKNARILEVGCGRGFFLKACQDRGAHSITGQEFRHADIAYAVEHLGIADIRSVRTGDIETWPNAEFDVVCSFDVIEHVHDLREFIEQCVRVTKPGGVLFHATPGYDSLSHLAGRVASSCGIQTVGQTLCNVQYVNRLTGGPHVSILGLKQLKWICQTYKLSLLHAEYRNSYSYSNEHYAKVIPSLRRLPLSVSSALFRVLRATIKNKLLFMARVPC